MTTRSCSRTAYPSDLTDAQFALIEPLLPPVKSGSPNGGRPAVSRREILDSIMYIIRTGASWRQMPHDLVKWQTAYHHFRLYCRTGLWTTIHDALRARVREADGRNACPSAAIIDSQSVKTTLKGAKKPAMTRGKRSRGRSATSSSIRSDSSSP